MENIIWLLSLPDSVKYWIFGSRTLRTWLLPTLSNLYCWQVNEISFSCLWTSVSSSLHVPPGPVCVHGVVVRPRRDHLAAPTRWQHPEEEHRRLHRQVCKYSNSVSEATSLHSWLIVWLFVCFICRHIAELIFYMEELRAHVRKYGPVMQRYYVQYLSGFDAVVLNELVQVRIPFQSYITQNLQQGTSL